jgi:hypothetical protein
VVDAQQQTWTCPDCQSVNSLQIKECQNPHCSQWRPMVKKAGDWNCVQCSFSNFASRGQCMRCNAPKVVDPYNMPPPSAPFQSVAPSPFQSVAPAPPLAQPPASRLKGYHQDWWCTNCQFKVFGSKAQCGKCGQKRH